MTHEPRILPPDLAEDAEAAARPHRPHWPQRPRVGRRGWFRLLAGAVLMVLLGVAGGIGYLMGGSASTPADDSAEAGFARDMQVHHAQAVEMSLIMREKSKDPALRAMAYDVITSQQQQSGQMYAWLDSWGLSQTSSRAPMAWMTGMDHSGMAGMTPGSGSMELLPDGRMPGMASAEQMTRLRAAVGRDAEVQWLQLMIPHHQAGVIMAEAVMQKSSNPQVVKLASAIRTAQLAEIDQMRQMLTDRGAGEMAP